MLRAGGAGPVVDVQGGAVVGDGGAQNGNVGGGGGGSLQRGGGVGQDQIHIVGHEAVDDGGAVGGIAGGVLLIKGHLRRPAVSVRASLKPWVAGVQSVVLHQLADADGVGLGGLGISSGSLGHGFRYSGGGSRGLGGGRSRTGAGRQRGSHHSSQKHCKYFFHFHFLPFVCSRCTFVLQPWSNLPLLYTRKGSCQQKVHAFSKMLYISLSVFYISSE